MGVIFHEEDACDAQNDPALPKRANDAKNFASNDYLFDICFHRMIHRAKTVSRFWSKTIEKKLQSSFNPFSKERRDLNFWRNGVISHGEYAGDAQDDPALPKRANHAKNFDPSAKNLVRKNFWASKNEMLQIV